MQAKASSYLGCVMSLMRTTATCQATSNIIHLNLLLKRLCTERPRVNTRSTSAIALGNTKSMIIRERMTHKPWVEVCIIPISKHKHNQNTILSRCPPAAAFVRDKAAMVSLI
jgi:hypothetical protein